MAYPLVPSHYFPIVLITQIWNLMNMNEKPSDITGLMIDQCIYQCNIPGYVAGQAVVR